MRALDIENKNNLHARIFFRAVRNTLTEYKSNFASENLEVFVFIFHVVEEIKKLAIYFGNIAQKLHVLTTK